MKNGVILALIGYAVYAWSDGMIKAVGQYLPVFQLGFFNILFASVFLLLGKPAEEQWRGFWRMNRPTAVHLRAALGALAGMCGVYAFSNIPLAEAYALMFMMPIWITILSVILLKEHVGPWRWFAVFAGFAGVLMVVRPGVRALEGGHFAAMAASILAAICVILMRTMSGERQTAVLGTLMVYALGANAIAAAATDTLKLPEWWLLGILVLTGACTAVGNRLQFLSTRYAPANVVAPTHYSQMLWAVAIGALFFAEYPDAMTLIGLAVIAASGLLTLFREYVRFGSVRWLPRGRV